MSISSQGANADISGSFYRFPATFLYEMPLEYDDNVENSCIVGTQLVEP